MAIDASQHLDFGAALSHEAAVQRELGVSHDFLEGVAAFLAKRAANSLPFSIGCRVAVVPSLPADAARMPVRSSSGLTGSNGRQRKS